MFRLKFKSISIPALAALLRRRMTRRADSTSVTPPPRTPVNRKSVPPPLTAAMAGVKTGEFIFDPTNGR